MQLCDACGQSGASKRCRPCEVTLCFQCLGDTDRCPSCQRSFASTAYLSPVVAEASPRPSGSGMRAPLFVGALVIIGLGVAMYVTRETEEPDVIELDANTRGWVAERGRDRPDLLAAPPTPDTRMIDDAVPSSSPCPFEAPPLAPTVSADGPSFDAALRRALEAEGAAHVDVFASYEGSPIPNRSRFEGDPPPNRLVFVVDQWRDPAPGLSGRVAGRALAFVGGRPRCAVEVEHEGGPLAADVDQARLDLVWGALSRGRGALRSVTPAPD